MNEDGDGGYLWEGNYEKSWEKVVEDEKGSVGKSVAEILHGQKRKRLMHRKSNVRLGIMRHMYIILDMSDSINEKDLPTDRKTTCIRLLNKFIDEFFDENPISQLGIITTQDKRAKTLSQLTGNAQKHKDALKTLKEKMGSGEPSIQNALETALRGLKLVPNHSSREVVMIMASLTTCDPTNISATITKLSEAGVRVNVIGLAAEVYVCRWVSEATYGSYSVILDDIHLNHLLSSHTRPQPATSKSESNLVKMGFPDHVMTLTEPSMCACHLDKFTSSGFFCPICKAKYCSLPVECKQCKLTLVTGPQLARSYQHLFPFQTFSEEELTKNVVKKCGGCLGEIDTKEYVCPHCSGSFCSDCDMLIHESLQTCPTCTV